MFIIVGLGNPTKEYIGTRHNIGFDAITRISDEYNIPLDFKKHKGICGKGMIGSEKVILIQPQTYMNLSGECIREAADYYKVEPEHIIVIYDDISLAPGQLRVRGKGSAGGHNGIKNIILHTGGQKFPRVRVGVGEKPADYDLADYVLGHFPKEDQKLMDEAFKEAGAAAVAIMTEGIDAAMNKFNGKK